MMNQLQSLFLLSLFLTNLIFPTSNNLTQQKFNPDIAQILADGSQERWMNWMAALSGEIPVQTQNGEQKILTRSSLVMFNNSQPISAFDYLCDELKALGFVENQNFMIHTYAYPYKEGDERNWKNLILTFPGSDPSLKAEKVLLVAHLDSTSETPLTLAPGADDNASGAAGLLEAAFILRNYQFKRTIHLIWFSGEEQWRIGSRMFVKDYQEWLPDIIGVINLDMFAYDRDNDRCFEVHAGVLPGSRQIANHFAEVISGYHLNLKFDLLDDESAYHFSDHGSFWEQNVPAVMVYQNGFTQPGKTCGISDWNRAYHTSADTIDLINPQTGHSILMAAIAATALIARPCGGNTSQACINIPYTDMVNLRQLFIYAQQVSVIPLPE